MKGQQRQHFHWPVRSLVYSPFSNHRSPRTHLLLTISGLFSLNCSLSLKDAFQNKTVQVCLAGFKRLRETKGCVGWLKLFVINQFLYILQALTLLPSEVGLSILPHAGVVSFHRPSDRQTRYGEPFMVYPDSQTNTAAVCSPSDEVVKLPPLGLLRFPHETTKKTAVRLIIQSYLSCLHLLIYRK